MASHRRSARLSSEQGDRWRIRIATDADAHSIADIHEDAWRTLYSKLLPPAVVEAHAPQRTTDVWLGEIGRSNAILFVADNGNADIDGFMRIGPTRLDADASFDREITHFYLRTEVRRQGLGRAMIDSVLHRLVADGIRSVVVRVMDGNPFAKFYDSVGADHLGTRGVELYGHRVVEIVYAWRNFEESCKAHDRTAGEDT